LAAAGDLTAATVNLRELFHAHLLVAALRIHVQLRVADAKVL
jgi:hypothetical protein